MDNVYLKINATHGARRHDAESIHESAKDILSAQCNDTAILLASNERSQHDIKNKMDKHEIELQNIVYKLGDENVRRTNEKAMELETSIERTAKEISVAVERNGKIERDLIRDQESEDQMFLQHHHNSAMENHKDTQLDIQEMENVVSVDAVEKQGELQLGVSKSEGDITLDALQKATEEELYEMKIKQRVELDAYKNKMDFAKEAEDCCCEIKEHTNVKERETQILAKDVDVRRMRDELSLANTENLLLRFAGLL